VKSIPLVRSGALPVAILALATVLVLGAWDLALRDALLFGGYVAVAIALPGMLWVRLLRGRRASLAEDLSLGLALGYALQIGAYLVARLLDVPQASPAWAVASLALFAIVPSWRRHWRSGDEPPPLWWSWAICGILAILLAYSTTVFGTHRLNFDAAVAPYVDMPYQLALIGELRHHVPPQVPYLAGERLAYHWFFYVQAAAISWATGIEAITLLYRLAILPMLAGFVVLTAVTARHLTGQWWPGPVAVAIALFGAVATPYGWVDGSVFGPQPVSSVWLSPTSTFGMFLLAAILLVVLGLLAEGRRRARGGWLLVAILVFAGMGAKASVLPLLGCGFAAVLVIGGLRRSLDRAALTGIAIVAAAGIVALVLVFRGATGGVVIGFDSLRAFAVARSIGAGSVGGVSAYAIPLVVLTVALVLWGLLWAGAFGLLSHRFRLHRDRRLWLLVGVAGAAIGATSFLHYPGLSQLYYLRGAAGVFALLAAWGIAVLVGRRGQWHRVVGGAAAALALGAVLGWLVQLLGPDTVSRRGVVVVVIQLVVPVAVLLAGLGVAALVLRRLSVRLGLGIPAGLIAVGLAMGPGLPASWRILAEPELGPGPAGPTIPADGITAARWLRENSEPDDLAATNRHCLQDRADGRCDARHFWVSAFSERRVLVEGWAYTETAFRIGTAPGVDDRIIPFWDQTRLAENDRAFTEPAEGVAPLRDRAGVRWLFADLGRADAAALDKHALLRFRAGEFAVYELRAP
jgi:hypothetical protein